jgi:Mn-dependent DtxR family transcriptional regulator
MTAFQINRDSKDRSVRSVYSIIKNHSGRITTKHLEKEIGSKHEVHYALRRLSREGKIKRIRGFGVDRVEYFYEDIACT